MIEDETEDCDTEGMLNSTINENQTSLSSG
jgi:hypothetical protein